MFTIKGKNGYLVISKGLLVVLIMDFFSVIYYMSALKLTFESRMFPTILLVLIAVLSVVCYAKGIHYYKELPKNFSEEIEKAPRFDISGKLIAFIIMAIVLSLLFDIVGAIVCMWIFMVSVMIMLGVKNKLVLIIVPLVEVIFIYFVFKVWLAVPLPSGFIPFL